MSSLKIFADQCVPMQIVNLLRIAGYEVLILRDFLEMTAIDADVIRKSQDLEAILLSLNGDFADIITYPPSRYRGIFCLQIKNHPETVPQIVARMTNYLQEHNDPEHYKGKLFVVDQGRIRIRT